MDTKLKILAAETVSRFEMSTNKYQYRTRNVSLKFTSKVYVLINRFSFSESIVVSAMIQDYRFGKFIGEQTTPLMYANARSFKLTNTQIRITFPEGGFVRANGDASLHGTVPNYLISDDMLTEKDEVLDYTLNLIIKENK